MSKAHGLTMRVFGVEKSSNLVVVQVFEGTTPYAQLTYPISTLQVNGKQIPIDYEFISKEIAKHKGSSEN